MNYIVADRALIARHLEGVAIWRTQFESSRVISAV